jgi:hypothetical protein
MKFRVSGESGRPVATARPVGVRRSGSGGPVPGAAWLLLVTGLIGAVVVASIR